MTDLRTTRSTICFNGPFVLRSLEVHLPAGTYEIDTEEQIIEGNERRVYVRLATLLRVHSTGKVETMTVDPNELNVALQKDGAPQG